MLKKMITITIDKRGVQDILIASIDGLKSFPEAIKLFFHKQKYNYVSYIKAVIQLDMWLLKIKKSL